MPLWALSHAAVAACSRHVTMTASWCLCICHMMPPPYLQPWPQSLSRDTKSHLRQGMLVGAVCARLACTSDEVLAARGPDSPSLLEVARAKWDALARALFPVAPIPSTFPAAGAQVAEGAAKTPSIIG